MIDAGNVNGPAPRAAASVPKLLVTGHAGFVGHHVLEQIARRETGNGFAALTLPVAVDIRAPALAGHIADLAPDAVLHLAALSSPADSFRDFDAYVDVNFRGTLNLLRALQAAGFRGRMVFVSSGDCYGSVPEAELPIGEDRPLRPRNPYAVSKVAAEALCYQWSQTEGLDVVIARPFNHIGPGQDERFAVAAFAAQVARIALGKAPPRILTGNLDVTRDFTDVRDVVRAYFALFAKGRRGEAYNIGSGREARIADVLDRLVELAGVDVEIALDPSRVRAVEQRRVAADVRKIESQTGWVAHTPLEQSLRDALDYWKGKIAND
jgi:GDP-4-dehydro-6-deoxy-D-mannose reductase